MSQLLTYRKFNDLALARDLVKILDDAGIEYLLEESPVIFNPTFATRTEASNEYVIKISNDDFVRADQIIEQHELKFTEEVAPDHYLFGFTDDELTDVVAKADEWSAFDVVLAKKILRDRGKSISQEQEQALKQERLAELKTPERSDSNWVTAGYLFAACGGVLGLFIGWQLWQSKKIMPNGEQVYTYNQRDRSSGQQIFYLSIASIVLLAFSKMMEWI